MSSDGVCLLTENHVSERATRSDVWSERMSFSWMEWSVFNERMFRVQRLKTGPGLGSMEPERQSSIVKIV